MLQLCCYLHSFSCCCLPNLRNPAKFYENSNLQQFKVILGIDLGVNRKRICNFLLLINGRISALKENFIFGEIEIKHSKNTNRTNQQHRQSINSSGNCVERQATLHYCLLRCAFGFVCVLMDQSWTAWVLSACLKLNCMGLVNCSHQIVFSKRGV